MGRDLHYRPGSFYRKDDRTGFPQRAERTRKEWNGYIVDESVWEPRQPQDLVRGVKDQQNVPDPRPLPPNQFIDLTYTATTAQAYTDDASLEMSSAEGFFDGQEIGVMLDSGVYFWTTVAGDPIGTTINLANPLPYNASGGNLVAKKPDHPSHPPHPTPPPPPSPPPPAQLSVSIAPQDAEDDRVGAGLLSQAFVSTVAGGTPPYAYAWTMPGLTVTGADQPNATGEANVAAPSDTTYNVSLAVDDSGGQSAGVSTTVRFVATVLPPPPPPPPPPVSVSITPDAPTDTRVGDGSISQDFVANVTGGTSPFTYTWTMPGLTVTGGTTANASGAITVTAPYDTTFPVSVHVEDSLAQTADAATTVRMVATVAPAFPVLQPASQRRGRLTKAGAAAIAMADMMLLSGAGITSWAIALISGTAGHWTFPTDGTSPTPTAAGVAAGLNGGPYVFSVTATNAYGTSAAKTLTITTFANLFTVSKKTEITAITTGGDSNSAIIDGKTLEFARYSTDLAVTTQTNRIYFTKWRAAAGRCVIQHEDPDHPCVLGHIQVRLAKNLDFVSILINSPSLIRTTANAADSAWWHRTVTPSADAPDYTGVRFLDTYGPCGVLGDGDPTHTIYGFYNDVASGTAMDYEATNLSLQWVRQGIFSNTSSTAQLNVSFFGRTDIRYFTGNGYRCETQAPGSSTHFDFLLEMSPTVDSTAPGTHADGIQPSNGENMDAVTIDRYVFVVADGNLTAAQGIFSRQASGVTPPDYSRLDVTIGNAIVLNRVSNAIVVSGTDVDHVFTLGQFTMMFQRSGIYGPDISPYTFNSPQYSRTPVLRFDAGTDPANCNADNGWVQGTISNATGIDVSSVTAYGGAADATGTFPNSAWVTSEPLKALLAANSTVQNYTGVDDVRWHGTIDEVLADITLALTPLLNGPAKNPDGTYRGALFPDGSLNDGSVY
jgi:hypothetical protein